MNMKTRAACRPQSALILLSGLIAGVAAAGCTAHAVQHDGRDRLSIEQLIDIRHPSNPMWSPDGQSVVFVWDRAGVSQVVVARATEAATGGGPAQAPRELPEAGATLAGAFWSADGRALMMPKGGDLWRVPIDGSAASPVWTTPQAERAITPSPDGTRVAFVRPVAEPTTGTPHGGGSGTGGSDLIVRSLADGRETRVLRADHHLIGSISWSPDGQYLAAGDAPHTIRHDQTPSYSGSKIIYTITENVPGETVVVPAAGGQARHLAVTGGGFGGNAPRRWVDARHFVFDRTSPDFKKRTTYLVDIQGGEPKVLHEDVEDKFWSMTGDAGANAQPSPDGKWIAFLSDRDGWDHLYVMPAQSVSWAEPASPIQITKGKFEAWRPAWSPDSQRIAFDANPLSNNYF